eukprot:CAMPEP_0181306642 /NCGR_PEP_ID=MMETSP1101-20121128/10419_1 /TAXON_ID=46948 /ORGANISM="Rhodomonas abbreviata, Strain Caron Lab Isolate" /LENGTH=124 /DNA_ID=CAMNT_0023412733 /DNA_START=139 /DNA_END=513 /DNA_ORIENTATION=+
MSWQAYVDDQLIGTRKVNKAAIIGLDGNIWAQSAGFNLPPAEGQAIAAASKAPNPAMPIILLGNKFMVLRAEDPSIYCRKDSDGACITKTNQCVILGMYGTDMQAGECNVAVEKLADYLREQGY